MKSILESHSVSVLKKEISKSNVKGYSKMKKSEIIELMLEHKEKFSHIKMAEKKERKKREKKERKKSEKKETHKMPDGSMMSGKTHSKDSKKVKKNNKKEPITVTKADGSKIIFSWKNK
tara:strand:+ start:2760 stop:3116 length:357 start_codon:yes stop_codon:yes gene_type:complete